MICARSLDHDEDQDKAQGCMKGNAHEGMRYSQIGEEIIFEVLWFSHVCLYGCVAVSVACRVSAGLFYIC